MTIFFSSASHFMGPVMTYLPPHHATPAFLHNNHPAHTNHLPSGLYNVPIDHVNGHPTNILQTGPITGDYHNSQLGIQHPHGDGAVDLQRMTEHHHNNVIPNGPLESQGHLNIHGQIHLQNNSVHHMDPSNTTDFSCHVNSSIYEEQSEIGLSVPVQHRDKQAGFLHRNQPKDDLAIGKDAENTKQWHFTIQWYH